jgi:hypothetical protein
VRRREGKDEWVEQLVAKQESVTTKTAAMDLISGMGGDQDRWKTVLQAMAAGNEARELRRGTMDKCERMGRLEPYTREANANDAGDLNWNVMEEANRRMEWMRTELGVNWAMDVGELRLGIAGDLDSKVGRAMEHRRVGP